MTQSAVAKARAAVERRDWEAAYAALHDAGALPPRDGMMFADACWLTGRHVEARRAYERALASFEAEDAREAAAECAIWLSRIHAWRSEPAIARGFVRRAERLLEGVPDSPARGHLDVLRSAAAQGQGQLEEALAHAVTAEDLGRRHGDAALQALALNRQGRILIAMGRVDEAQARIDESMALVTAERVHVLPAFLVYCGAIDACTDLGDYARAGEWTDLTNDWCDGNHLLGNLGGACRIHRAEILHMRGAWELAARELTGLREEFERLGMKVSAGWGLCVFGLQQLRVGDLDGAERSFCDAHALGFDPQPGLSLLWVRRGKTAAAIDSLQQALAEREGRPLARAKLLPALVEAALAHGDADMAERATAELEEIADRFGTTGLRARALAARGTTRLAADQAADAIGDLRRAIAAWCEIGAPYEIACLRDRLAEAHEACGNVERARLERDAARTAFAQLGASIDTRAQPDPGATIDAPRSAPSISSGPTVHIAVDIPIGGKLEVVRAIGRGAMGVVFEARHRLTGRRVAVKVLHPGLGDDPRRVDGLLREALACGRVRHPNVVDVYDAGMHDGAPYLVLELLEGEPLSARIAREGALAPVDARDLVAQALRGVAAAHAVGIVHRDLKPDNLFLARDANTDRTIVKVLDFGISKLQQATGCATQVGAIVGTPFYMSPEQVEARHDVDGRADVYALGVVLYELLTGERPFAADGYASLLLQIATVGVPSPRVRRPEIPEPLDAIVLRATAIDRHARFDGAAAFEAALAGLQW